MVQPQKHSLLVLSLLCVLSTSVYRYSKTSTLPFTPSSITPLSSSVFALTNDSYISLYNPATNVTTQTLALNNSAGSSSQPQFMAATQDVVFIKDNTLYELRQKTGENSEIYWPVAFAVSRVAAYQGKLSFAKLNNATVQLDVRSAFNASDDIVIGWSIGSTSPIYALSNPVFETQTTGYIINGGTCSSNQSDSYPGTANLRYWDINTIANSRNFTFSLPGCNFDQQLYLNDWYLTSEVFEDSYRYFVFSYINSQNASTVTTNQVATPNASDFTMSGVSVNIDKQLGIKQTSADTVYTAESKFCSVTWHNTTRYIKPVDQQYIYYQLNAGIQVDWSQNYAVGIVTNALEYASLWVLQIAQNGTITPGGIYSKGNCDYVKSGIVSETYLLALDSCQDRNLTFYTLDNTPFIGRGPAFVLDFCVGTTNTIFMAANTTGTVELSANTIENKTITPQKTIELDYTPTVVTCMPNNYFIVESDTQVRTYLYSNSQFSLQGTLTKQSSAAIYTYIGQLVMEKQSQNSSTTKFYHYNLTQVPAAVLPLPPIAGVNYEILSNVYDGMMIQVKAQTGSDSFTELRYITATGNTLKYSGSFVTYQTDMTFAPNKTVAVPGKDKVHLGYSRGNSGWQVYYTLSQPPIYTVGYINGGNTACSQYTSANFQMGTNGNINMQAVDTVNALSKIDFFTIKVTSQTVSAISSFDLTGFNNDGLKVYFLQDSQNYLIAGNTTGTADEAMAINLRNVNQIDKLLFAETTSFIIPKVVTGGFYTQGQVGVFGSLNFGAPKPLRMTIASNTGSQIALTPGLSISTISHLGVCPSCNLIAFVGKDATQTAVNRIYVQQYTASPATATSIATDCTPDRVFLSDTGSRVGWTCQGSTVYVAKVGATGAFYQGLGYSNIKTIEFVDEGTLIIADDKDIYYLSLPIATTVINAPRVGNTPSNSDYLVAVNPATSTYVTTNSSKPGVLLFKNADGSLAQTFTMYPAENIASMTYSSSGQLFVTTTSAPNSLISLTTTVCPSNKTFIEGYCYCNSLFTESGDDCICQYDYSSPGECTCGEGYYESNNDCSSCSGLCDTCNGGGAFDCDKFGAWFYVMIVGIVLVVGAAIVVTVVLCHRKRKTKENTQPMIQNLQVETTQRN